MGREQDLCLQLRAGGILCVDFSLIQSKKSEEEIHSEQFDMTGKWPHLVLYKMPNKLKILKMGQKETFIFMAYAPNLLFATVPKSAYFQSNY